MNGQYIINLGANSSSSGSLNNNNNNNKSARIIANTSDDDDRDDDARIVVNYSNLNHQNVLIEKNGGLANRYVLFILMLWYVLSALTLYTNKYIVTYGKGDPTLLGAVQMTITSICGFIQLNSHKFRRNASNPIKLYTNNSNHAKDHSKFFSKPNLIKMRNTIKYYLHFCRDMLIIGALRLFSIIVGLMALKQAAVSFVETIKSSSPIFTVFISRLLIGEKTGFWTNISLIPIMLGLTLCSSFEINFSLFGLCAAILTNFSECLQNVFSKLLLCGEKYKYSPLQVQFFTSFASVLVLVPLCLLSIDTEQLWETLSVKLVLSYIVNAVFFHGQSLFAFTLMSYISPITHSVLNTLKRAILIWLSVLVFQNQVSYASLFGTMVVICGVFLYNHARYNEKKNETKLISLSKV